MIIFIFFCFKYDFYLFWFQISPLINVHRHQIPQWRTSELTGSVLLSKLTVGELLCWLNHSLSWAEVVAEHSRYGKKKKKKQRRRLRDASCLSQGENCVGSRNSHNTSSVLASLWVPLRGTYEAERLIQMILCRLLLSYEHLSSLEVF